MFYKKLKENKYDFQLKTCYAFTLAEVLIVLAIIGVIAAALIPALIENTQKQEYVTAMKKTYSVLSQATNLVINEQGGTPDTWEMIDGSDADTDRIMGYYAAHLNNLKACKSGDHACDYSDNLLNINGSISQMQNTWGQGLGSNTFNWIMPDGTYLAFDIHNSSRINIINIFGVDPGWDCTATSGYGRFTIDVNGNKKPNQLGRDVFVFILTNKGLVPAGIDDNSTNCTKTTINGFGGADCAAKVIKEGAENY